AAGADVPGAGLADATGADATDAEEAADAPCACSSLPTRESRSRYWSLLVCWKSCNWCCRTSIWPCICCIWSRIAWIWLSSVRLLDGGGGAEAASPASCAHAAGAQAPATIMAAEAAMISETLRGTRPRLSVNRDTSITRRCTRCCRGGSGASSLRCARGTPDALHHS